MFFAFFLLVISNNSLFVETV